MFVLGSSSTTAVSTVSRVGSLVKEDVRRVTHVHTFTHNSKGENKVLTGTRQRSFIYNDDGVA